MMNGVSCVLERLVSNSRLVSAFLFSLYAVLVIGNNLRADDDCLLGVLRVSVMLHEAIGFIKSVCSFAKLPRDRRSI
jgi:hypothetical protein